MNKLRSFLLPAFLLCCASNLFAQITPLTRFDIASNLHILVKGKFPSTHPPFWSHVSPDYETAFSIGNRIEITTDNFNTQSPDYKTLQHTSIGAYQNKAVVFFSKSGSCMYVADIDLPERDITLSNELKIYKLSNFRPVAERSKGCEPQYENIPALKKISGSIGLRATNEATIYGAIVLDFAFESGQRSSRRSGSFTSPLFRSAARSNELAAGQKYIDLLEPYARYHYQGWNFDKLYGKNTIENVLVLEKDLQGRPTVLKADCSLGSFDNPWIKVLFNNGQAYGVIYSTDSLAVVTPPKNFSAGDNRFKGAELLNIQRLQDKYMKKLMQGIFDSYPQSKNLEYLTPAPFYNTVRATRTEQAPQPVMTSRGVESEMVERSVNYNKEVEEKGLRNVGKKDLVIYISNSHREHDGYTLIYSNGSTLVEVGETIPYMDLRSLSIANRLPSKGGINNNSGMAPFATKAKPGVAKAGHTVSSKSFEVDADNLDTNLDIRKGDKISFEALGTIVLGFFAGSGGPTGIDGYETYCIKPEFRHGALLFRIGQSSWAAVGNTSSHTASVPGKLQFLINDNDTSNNSGAFKVFVKVNR